MTKNLVIEEAGVNHNGDIGNALALVDAASEAGADIVKFQTFKADTLASRSAAKASYQMQSTGAQETQHSMLKRLELSEDFHYQFLSTLKLLLFISSPVLVWSSIAT